MTGVIIQGGPASYSEWAAHCLLGRQVSVIHASDFQAALDHYRSTPKLGLLLPWSNNQIGPIPGAQSLIRQSGLEHDDEIHLPVRHCLISMPGKGHLLKGRIHSHPAALDQCRLFFHGHPALQPTITHDTADSVAALSRLGGFAIASRIAALRYGMEVLKENIQDRPDNATSFRYYSPGKTH